MKPTTRRAVFSTLAILVALWVGWGLRLASIHPPESDAYLWGAFHVHSTLSDGLGDLATIAEGAAESRVDVVFLSDHGMPHREASAIDETIGGIRFVGGSEVGFPEGHLIATHPTTIPDYKLPPHPPEAIDEVREAGGFAVVTYPEDVKHGWKYWKLDRPPDAIEIVNMTSYFRASHLGQKLKWAAFYPFQPLVYLSAVEPPTFALQKWDELLKLGQVSGMYSVNAHGGFAIAGEHRVPTPSYADTFRFAGMAIEKRYAEEPETALRSGDFFSVLRGAAEPKRFEFWAEQPGNRIRPGSVAPAASAIHVALELERYTPTMRLLKDGKTIRESTSEIHLEKPALGTYRVEVYLTDHPLLNEDVPWIISNAITLGGVSQRGAPPPPTCKVVTPLPLDRLVVERDKDSKAELQFEEGSNQLTLRYTLAEATEENVNRWVALALREPIPIGPFSALRITARADRPMRFWIELRSESESHYGSIKIWDKSVGPTFLLYENFYEMFGSRSGLPIEHAESFFLTLNTSNSFTNLSGTLTLESIELCALSDSR